MNCAGLEDALDDAVAGDIVELTESCTDQSFNVSDMPGTAGSPVTLRGTTGTEELNGGAPSTPIFTGTDVRHLIVSQLTFRNGFTGGNGGAMSVTGDSALTLDQVTFLGNHADGTGGAVYTTDTNATDSAGPVVRFSHFGDPNDPSNVANMNDSGLNGGALAIQTVSDSSVHNTTFDGNLAQTSGGAFYMQDTNAPGTGIRLDWFDNPIFFNHSFVAGGGVYIDGGEGSSLVSGNQVIGNSVDVPENLTGRSPLRAQAVADGDHFGGGAVMEFTDGGTVDQQRNTFQANSIDDQNDAMDYGGGGEWVSGANVTSLRDRFLANVLPDVGGSGDNEGGGLGFEGGGTTTKVFDAFDLVAAGNQVGSGGGEGAGIYVGAGCTLNCVARLELTNSTVAGNDIADDGQGPGVAGGLSGDQLILRNSIVFGNTGALPEIEGFETTNVFNSDACAPGGATFAGPGNMCEDPQLVAPQFLDIHQTGSSPTVDKGDDAFIESDSGQDVDFEDDPRSTDGDGDGHTVDIGADESPAFVAQQPPPPPTPEQCADGKDNDGDGAIDLADPGCASVADDNEGDESLSALLLCGSRVISLVRADAVGKKAVLSGVVASKYAGKKVAIYANYRATGVLKKVASVKAGAAGAFKARLKLPSKRRFNKVRFQARIAGAKSAKLKLPQSLASSSVKHKGTKLELRGTVKRALLGKRNTVIVRRLTCGHYKKVGQAKPSKKGKYVVRFDAPAGSSAALYRAETRTLNKPHGRQYVKQYARAIGITLAANSH